MIEDVYEPLARYRDEFAEKFGRLAREKFCELTEKSGVDIATNRAKVAEINALTANLSSEKTKLFFKGFLIFVCVCGLIGGAVLAYSVAPATDMLWGIGVASLSFFAMCFSIPWYSKTSKKIAGIKTDIARAMAEAQKQMEPLNRLYTWDITVKLIEQTVPRLAFDPYFTAQRLSELENIFGWDNSYNDDKSVCFAQSGEINGNPFVFGDCLEMQWGTESYTGYKQISWTSYETGADGKRHLITRHQTLSATVQKPIPRYSNKKFLIYGNNAAPNLSFSREPSKLSGTEGDWLASIEKKWTISRLKSFSQNLDDDSQFTLMSNHEFEALFNAKNRDNEVEFRLLFTALAQTQMLLLLNDKHVGFGDDFYFVKRKKINMLFSRHLSDAVLDTAPSRFVDWNYERARENFLNFNEKYFKDVYFALAPILAIPLYQQTRTAENIYKDTIGTPSSFWEHEAIANFYGDSKFKHANCATRSILKTRLVSRDDGIGKVEVTAYGYRGVDRVEVRTVFGGDLKFHDVAVHWTEYLPVSKTTPMYLSEGKRAEPRAASASEIFRRSIFSYLSAR